MSSFTFEPAVPGLECIHQGKVRDTFALPGYPELLLAVATDRVSTHNIVHESVIPQKGGVLTGLTVFWMTKVLREINTHLASFRDGIFPYLPYQAYPDDIALRALVIRKLAVIPVEFIFRNYMAGSLWKDYYQKGLPNPYGLELPSGLQLMSPFEHTVFTPTDKSETDDPLNAGETARQYPEAYQLALRVYEAGRAYAAVRGITIIDGKFEVGIDSFGRVCLADECLTPDSCRFVEADTIVVGQEPAWFDKQFLREEAERAWAGGKKAPLTFSPAVIAETTRRYEDIFCRLTGVPPSDFQSKQRFYWDA